TQTVRVAMIASIVIALFSFVVTPLLWFAPEGLWQIIRIFTGFYNIPIIAIVLVGLFTRRTPALGAKIVIVFHVIAYGIYRALAVTFPDLITLHFLHIYAILFAVEVAIMLLVAQWKPRETAWVFTPAEKVDLTPWRFVQPTAVTLLSLVVAVYALFSPIGLASGALTPIFYGVILLLGMVNLLAWTKLRGAPALVPLTEK
ncbi:MAG: solute:sodium symporter family transporter, partial [Pseudomonadota bacterium]